MSDQPVTPPVNQEQDAGALRPQPHGGALAPRWKKGGKSPNPGARPGYLMKFNRRLQAIANETIGDGDMQAARHEVLVRQLFWDALSPDAPVKLKIQARAILCAKLYPDWATNEMQEQMDRGNIKVLFVQHADDLGPDHDGNGRTDLRTRAAP